MGENFKGDKCVDGIDCGHGFTDATYLYTCQVVYIKYLWPFTCQSYWIK